MNTLGTSLAHDPRIVTPPTQVGQADQACHPGMIMKTHTMAEGQAGVITATQMIDTMIMKIIKNLRATIQVTKTTARNATTLQISDNTAQRTSMTMIMTTTGTRAMTPTTFMITMDLATSLTTGMMIHLKVIQATIAVITTVIMMIWPTGE